LPQVARFERDSSGLSRFGCFARQLGMSKTTHHPWRWLTAAVLVHLVVSMTHGVAHTEAQVPLSRPSSLFVYIVILGGPLAGLALSWVSRRTGSWLIALTLAGSLAFGVVNHFVLASPDHVSQVAVAWRPLFATTAVLLALLEAAGSGLAFSMAMKEGRS